MDKDDFFVYNIRFFKNCKTVAILAFTTNVKSMAR